MCKGTFPTNLRTVHYLPHSLGMDSTMFGIGHKSFHLLAGPPTMLRPALYFLMGTDLPFTMPRSGPDRFAYTGLLLVGK